MTRKLLVTDDDPMLMALYKSFLKGLTGVEVSYASSLEGARRLLAREHYDLALLDINLTPTTAREGFLLLGDLVKKQDAAVFMMSSDFDEFTISECTRRGAIGFVPKKMGFARGLPEIVRHALAA